MSVGTVFVLGLVAGAAGAAAVCEADFTKEELIGVYYQRLEDGTLDPTSVIVVDPEIHQPCNTEAYGSDSNCDVDGVDHWGYFMYWANDDPKDGMIEEGYPDQYAFLSYSGLYFWCPSRENDLIILTTNYELQAGKVTQSERRDEFVKQEVNPDEQATHSARKSCVWESRDAREAGDCTFTVSCDKDCDRCTPLLEEFCWNGLVARNAKDMEACDNALEATLKTCMESGEGCVHTSENGACAADDFTASTPVPLDGTVDFTFCREKAGTNDFYRFRQCAECAANDETEFPCSNTWRDPGTVSAAPTARTEDPVSFSAAPTARTVTPTEAPTPGPEKKVDWKIRFVFWMWIQKFWISFWG